MITTKEIKTALKRDFPLVSFSVRSQRSQYGNDIIIGFSGGDWTLFKAIQQALAEYLGQPKPKVRYLLDDGWVALDWYRDDPRIEKVMVGGTGEFFYVEEDDPERGLYKGWYERLECGHFHRRSFYKKKVPTPKGRRYCCWKCGQAKAEQEQQEHTVFLKSIGL